MLFDCKHCEQEVSNIYLSTDNKYLCWSCLSFSDKMWHKSMDAELKFSKMPEPIGKGILRGDMNFILTMDSRSLKSVNGIVFNIDKPNQQG